MGHRRKWKEAGEWLIESSEVPCSPANQPAKQGAIISAAFREACPSDMNK